jgi:hypothetical protein
MIDPMHEIAGLCVFVIEHVCVTPAAEATACTPSLQNPMRPDAVS